MGTKCGHVHDGNFFKELARKEKEKLVRLAQISDQHLEVDYLIPDEHRGLLRSTTGKAKLLVKERFRQFEGLCDSSLNPKKGQPEIRAEDLGGFWDMIMLEVRKLINTFSQIAEMAKVNWSVPVDQMIKNEHSNSKETLPRPQSDKTKRATKKKGIAAPRKPVRPPKLDSLQENSEDGEDIRAPTLMIKQKEVGDQHDTTAFQ